MNIVVIVLCILAGVLIAFALGLILHKKQVFKNFEEAQYESRKLIEEARKEADILNKLLD